jgi:steroid delta-isomerase-like uncharacterized protein
LTAAENKEVVRRFVDECVNRHRADLLEEFLGPRLTMHPGTPGSAPATEGVDQLRESFRRLRAALPDLRVTLEALIGEGDLVAARWTATGTHSGELAGVPGTGNPVRWGGVDVYRLADGRITEWWRNDDFVHLLAQIGRPVL